MAAWREILVHRASRAQQRLWFAEQVTPGEPVNNINVALWFAAPLDPRALAAALADVIARHESLRTAFSVRDGVLQQVVLEAPETPPFRTVDLSGPPREREAAFGQLREREAGACFALEAAPLLRLVHARAGDRDALVLVVHHIVADAWSVGRLLVDLARAYGSRSAGREPGWEPLPVQYADFTAWQEERLAGPEAQRHLVYWRERLAGLPTLDLTHGRPRPERPSAAGRRVAVAAAPRLRERLEAFVRAQRATPFMGVVAAYAAALGAVFGSQDVTLSSTVAGRPLPEVADVVGLFVDRVVLRLELGGRPGFRELLARARDAVVAAHDHDHVTFDQVVDAVQPERRLGVTPLAQAAINMLPALPGLEPGNLPAATGDQFGNGTVPHDLGLELALDGEWRLEYRPDVVDGAAARRVAALVPRLLEAGLAAPDRPLCLVPAAEDLQLSAAQDGGPALGGPPTVWDLVAGWMARTPGATAVAGPSGTLTYAELDAHARALADRLRERGVGPEATVLLALPRSAELVVAMLGVLAAGGAYVPVDPGDPAEHLAEVAADVGARLALALPGAGVALPASVPLLPFGAGTPVEPAPAAPARSENAAYVLFTSGSTGRPKGVVVEHRNLVAYVRALLHRLQPPAAAVHLMVQAPTFDSCLTAIFGALCSGGAVHLVDEETARDPSLLAGIPADYLKITPGHLAALLASAGPAAGRLRPRRAVVLGGEPCPRELARGLRDAGWHVLDEYGPTETTVGVLSRWQDGSGAAWTATPPIGDPLPGVRVHVLDAEGMPAPPGCAGELHVAGALVSRGYVGQPARTGESFVPDPYGEPGARMYRTGDLVRLLPDGTFELLGRRDRQVKVRGVRVELGAVEAALLRHPGVARAAATLREGRLAAFVTPAAGPALVPSELTALARRVLPEAAVPATVVVLDRLPLTAHGKLDLAALPGPDGGLAVCAREAPATPTEAALVEVWRSALGTADIGVTQGFFEVGGDSIRAIQVISEARERGLALTMRHLFDQQAIRPIAALLDAAPTTPQPGEAVEVPVSGAQAYTAADFPDSGLDDAGLARLLAALGVDLEADG